MRIKKIQILFALTCIVAIVLVTFLLGKPNTTLIDQQDDALALEKRIRDLERDLRNNSDFVKRIGKSVSEILDKAPKFNEKSSAKPRRTAGKVWEKINTAPADNDCLFSQSQPLSTDIQMLDVYDRLKFDNPDGGVWKQGWDVQPDSSRFSNSNKLRVILVPHSHNDPGWIKTFEKYYEDQTRSIITNMVNKLEEDLKRKMIWAEISYLDLWWKESDQENRQRFQNLVKSGQIEIVTGGWVMNDEANTHYYAMIEQLTLGHEWMKQRLGVVPENGWAIDPFGMSASMAYLLKRSGLRNMIIQRVHYSIKKEFAIKKTLEFRWRQIWDRDGDTDMFCHMMPFYSYDVPHTCGPDPKVCCQFDFRRISISGLSPIHCPWRVPAVPITASNLEAKAALLLDQYRKKSSLYRTNVLFVPLGDDFRYDSSAEFDHQFNNYKKLFDYMNGRRDWFVEASFGTLHDYFSAVHSTSAGNSADRFPSLSGDFFSYADRNDHYWSGYYTSRPFYKHLSRVLECYLRSAEILYSMTWTHMHRLGVTHHNWAADMMALLVGARQSLSLFQHHDGITGTEKDHVLVDYSRKLLRGVQGSRRIIEQCAHYLLHPDQANFQPMIKAQHFVVDEERVLYNELPEKALIHLQDSRKRIVFFNSLQSERVELMTLRVTYPNVQVIDEQGQVVRVQLTPVFTSRQELSSDQFEISFIVSVPPLGMTTYFIKKYHGTIKDNTALEVARVVVRGQHPFNTVAPFQLEIKAELDPFVIQSPYIKASFGRDGFLNSITNLANNLETDINVQFVQYGTRNEGPDNMSGAYLFMPNGQATRVQPDTSNHVTIIKGSLRSQVEVHMLYVTHQITIVNSPGVDGTCVHIDNLVNIVGGFNIELAMRLVTSIKSDRVFYTDLNGLQMTRRERWDKLPLQAQFYPMPTMAYIEDTGARVTMASGQPLGVTSLHSGHLEVMLDRRLNQDDNRGLGQGVLDNVAPTLNTFRLLVESRMSSCQASGNRADGYPSLSAHKVVHAHLHPIHRLVWNADLDSRKMHLNFKPVLTESGSDIHLVNLRTMTLLPDDGAAGSVVQPDEKVALIIHRLGFDCCFPSLGFNGTTRAGEFSVHQLFPDYFANQIRPSTLTLAQEDAPIDKSFVIALRPMEVYSFVLQP